MKKKHCLLLLLLLIASGCRKKDPASPAINPETAVVSGRMNDTAFNFTEGLKNISTSAYYSTRFFTQNDFGSQFESVFLEDTTRVFTFTIGSLRFTSPTGVDTVSNADFYTYITSGNYTYTNSSAAIRGIEIKYTDPATRQVFSSTLANQNSPSFDITSVEKLTYRNTAAIKVSATFSCDLQSNTREIKRISNGVVRMYFQNH
jgi:hypothetical protein